MINKHDIDDLKDYPQPEGVWKDIPGWEGYYQASRDGSIKSVRRTLFVPNRNIWYLREYGGEILSPKLSKNGYLYVNLWRDNKGHMRAVHRLVCATYNPRENADQFVCNHLDANRQNNCANNLEFITQKENIIHGAIANGGEYSWEIAIRKRTASRRNALSET